MDPAAEFPIHHSSGGRLDDAIRAASRKDARKCIGLRIENDAEVLASEPINIMATILTMQNAIAMVDAQPSQ